MNWSVIEIRAAQDVGVFAVLDLPSPIPKIARNILVFHHGFRSRTARASVESWLKISLAMSVSITFVE